MDIYIYIHVNMYILVAKHVRNVAFGCVMGEYGGIWRHMEEYGCIGMLDGCI